MNRLSLERLCFRQVGGGGNQVSVLNFLDNNRFSDDFPAMIRRPLELLTYFCDIRLMRILLR